MVTFFILSVLAVACATPGESLPGGSCLEYTVDRCDFGQPDATTNAEPIEFCSLRCNSQPECKFFAYNYKKSQCNLYYTQEKDNFQSFCEELSGPKGADGSKSIDQCTISTSDPCKGITQSSCQYNGEIINTYPDVTTEELCQEFCQASPDCLSYNFEKKLAECRLRKSDDKTCDQVIVEKGVTSEDANKCRAGGIEKGNLVKTFSNFGPDFTITFDMKITEFPGDQYPHSNYYNILHLTTGEDSSEAGGRIPGLWLCNICENQRGTPSMLATIAMTKYTFQYITLEMNKQYFVELIQAEGFFTVKINHEQVWQVNSGSATFQNVKYYLSDPWFPSAERVGIISTPKILQG